MGRFAHSNSPPPPPSSLVIGATMVYALMVSVDASSAVCICDGCRCLSLKLTRIQRNCQVTATEVDYATTFIDSRTDIYQLTLRLCVKFWRWLVSSRHLEDVIMHSFKCAQHNHCKFTVATALQLPLLIGRSRQRERLHATGVSMCFFVCLSVCRLIEKNAIFSKTKQFRAMMFIDDL